MKFSLSWLLDHLETTADLATITTTLSAIGLEVESVTDRSAELAPFRIARIVEAEQHPNADRLQVCRVEIGSEEFVTVVCGAPNARAGLPVVFAPPGAVIPANGMVLKLGEIRGVKSEGMLVSMRELALGEDHEGIIELSDDAPVGAGFAVWAGLDDPVIEIAVTPNRGDALAVRGIARDLAAAGLGKLKPWDPEPVGGKFCTIGWKIVWKDACPWVVGRTIHNVKNGPSPDWLQRRLVSIGLRPINKLVDITNFYTYDLGRPMHVYDEDLIAGGTLKLRAGDPMGESFKALNGREIEITEEDFVIADAEKVVSLAGIIGGEATACNETTTNVFLEVALFDPVLTAKTGRRHQINTDARARFERGVDKSLLVKALDAATRMIVLLCGGDASEVTSAGDEPRWERRANLRFERLKSLGGADIAPDQAVEILNALGFETALRDEHSVTVRVPPWRNDIAQGEALDQADVIDAAAAQKAAEGVAVIEPEAELVEEVLRIWGIDKVPAVSLPALSALPVAALNAAQRAEALTRRVLAVRGFAECVSFSFMPAADALVFGPADDALKLLNPIAADLDYMRPTPLAALMSAAGRNAAHGYGRVALFEVGPGFSAYGQTPIAAALRAGEKARHWQGEDGADVFAIKGDLLAVLAALGVKADALTITTTAPGYYHPGRSGVVKLGPKTVVARFGALHPEICAEIGIEGEAVAFELFLDALPEPKARRRGAPDLAPLQPLRRDFAFVVKHDVTAEAVLRAAGSADRALIAGVSLFDVYVGDKIAEGMKSLGLEVILQPRERTLTDEEIEAVCAKIVETVTQATGGTLR